MADVINEIPRERPRTPLLDEIDYPQQLRKLQVSQLPGLAKELRNFLLYSVGQTGGHLGANLGVVELCIALHYVFDTPKDKLIWDVGHQAYPHKIITGRRQAMETIRQKGGLAPFPAIEESEYDTFGTGHSSTSISAAMGIAEAIKIQGGNEKSIAVIGDGAMTAGMAFEAINNAGDLKTNLLIILNDNSMSISGNVGALSNFFGEFVGGKAYINIKELLKPGISEHLPKFKQLLSQTEEGIKHMLIPPSAFFETLGFNYTGILDGHDLNKLVNCLKGLKTLSGPQILHIKTCKGKGLIAAEEDPIGYHALSKVEVKVEVAPKTSTASKQSDKIPKYTDVFSKWICEVAKEDKKIVAITPAMREGSGLVEFSRLYPDRYYDVGIAEQHAMTLAGGLASQGMKPVLAIYSTFLQRAYDQLIHDIAVQNLPILLAIDRGGLVGEDGATHQGVYDLTYLRCIPNISIMAAADEYDLHKMLDACVHLPGIKAVRYPRGKATGIASPAHLGDEQAFEFGKARILYQAANSSKNNMPVILSFGAPSHSMKSIAESEGMILVDMRFVKPLDTQLLMDLAKNHKRFVTLEENAVAGGAGSAVLEFFSSQNINNLDVLCVGIEDEFIDHASQKEQRLMASIDPENVLRKIKSRWKL